jgi:hypothetical protein
MDTYRSDFGRTEAPINIPTRSLRRFKQNRKVLFHRVKNGVYDPITFYHVVDGLLQLRAWRPFKSADLATYLRERAPNIVWDNVTVGRILSDIEESFAALEKQVIRKNRKWDGVTYEVSDHAEHRQALVDLLEDLNDLATQEMEAESTEGRPKRTESPLVRCPSLAMRV